MRFKLTYLDIENKVEVRDNFRGSSTIVENTQESIYAAIRSSYKVDVYFLSEEAQEKHADASMKRYAGVDFTFKRG